MVNGVFLVALCLSIFLEAIQRFVEPQTVSNPKLVLIVGCFGLLSNVLGLFLFHEHGHSHGGDHGRSHGADNTLSAAEEGYSHAQEFSSGGHTRAVADESGNIADVLPQNTIGGWPKSSGMNSASREGTKDSPRRQSKGFTKSDEDESTITTSTSPLSPRKSNTSAQRRLRQNSGSRTRYSSVDDIHIHPASFRNDIIAASRLEDIESQADSDSEDEEAIEEDEHEATEGSPLLAKAENNGTARHSHHGHSHKHGTADQDEPSHSDHKHSKPKEENGGGHSHSDLNMRGVFLHVMGDALGNVGVIASALFIWLTDFSWRFYSDPAISLIITIIILGSAIPLCKAASRILLQAVPAGISIDDIKDDIEELPGIISCHHLHVWSLSDVKLVASLHVQVEFDFKGEGSARYMQLARAVRRCLHDYGIHSSTIQPEFCLDSEHRHTSGTPSDNEDHGEGGSKSKDASKSGSRAPSVRSQPEACLLECGDECDEGGQCCAPAGSGPEMGHEQG